MLLQYGMDQGLYNLDLGVRMLKACRNNYSTVDDCLKILLILNRTGFLQFPSFLAQCPLSDVAVCCKHSTKSDLTWDLMGF